MVLLRIFIGICLAATPLFAGAQFGAQVEYLSLDSPWEDTQPAPDGEYLDQLVSMSLLYWFRLRNKRIEFLPQLGYAFSTGGSDVFVPIKQQRIFLAFNTDIYLFDLLSDCDCPTFSKQGNAFTRGFFLEVSPALDYQMIRTENFPTNESPNEEQAFTFRIGLGVGFDIGISDLITITPMVHADHGGRPDWQKLPRWPSVDPLEVSGGEWLLRAGVRVMFRPDYVRKYR